VPEGKKTVQKDKKKSQLNNLNFNYRYKPNFFLQLPQNRCLVFLLSVPKSAPHLSHFFLIIVYYPIFIIVSSSRY
jgi:hypothetical protein